MTICPAVARNSRQPVGGASQITSLCAKKLVGCNSRSHVSFWYGNVKTAMSFTYGMIVFVMLVTVILHLAVFSLLSDCFYKCNTIEFKQFD